MSFQLGAGLLEACVLGILKKEDTYGYKLTQEVRNITNVSESTLYPVLRRLMKEGYLETYDQEYMGRNRRYYHLTAKGVCKHIEDLEEWVTFSQKVTQLLKGELT